MGDCVACGKPLVLIIQDSDNEEDQPSSSTGNAGTPNAVPDDVQLQCSCHFHWQCLLDAYNITSCPNCQRQISSLGSQGQEVVLVSLNNEGGLQEGLDILPLLTEESYLKAYPEERKSRAFLEFIRENDLDAVMGMVRESMDTEPGESDEDEDEVQDVPQQSFDQILRYQDPLDGSRSALHIAIVENRAEIAWLLLFLASTLETEAFPPPVLQSAAEFGLIRRLQNGLPDVRGLKDGEGRTAADLANQVGSSIIDARLLAQP